MCLSMCKCIFFSLLKGLIVYDRSRGYIRKLKCFQMMVMIRNFQVKVFQWDKIVKQVTKLIKEC
ncbi:hypothetical protein V6Z11_A10G275100 [Gossypium hirsutum]